MRIVCLLNATLAFLSAHAPNEQGVEENYLEVTKDDYLIVTEVRAGTTVSTLPSGKLNVIEALYQPLEQANPYVAPTVRALAHR